MNIQAGIQAPPQSSGGKKWLMGCGIALLVVLLAVGGFVYWGVMKAKEWGNNPALITLASALKFDDTYELVDKNLEAKSVTVKETATGEISVWTLKEVTEGSETVELIDDKGRTITIGGSSGQMFTVTEPSVAPAEEAPAVEEMPEESTEPAEDGGI